MREAGVNWMTVDEVLDQEDRTDTRYMLVDGEWHAQLLGKGAVLTLATCDLPIPLDDIYGNVLD